MIEKKTQRLMDMIRSLPEDSQSECLDSILESLERDDIEYQEALAWIGEKQMSCDAEVRQVEFNQCLGKWIIDDVSGDIFHESGGFFRIIGVDVKTDKRESGTGWCQPMVDQGTESSVAGIIRQKKDGIFQYLVEAKFEPGNYNKVLISPTLQVTYSNLNQLHKGKRPLFAEYFDGSNDQIKILYEHWLPEDGGRFYLKRVKYILAEASPESEIDISANYKWLKLNTLKRLLGHDNLINPHVRSILAIF